MPLVVSHQRREAGPDNPEFISADYDWPFAIDKCEVVREPGAVTIRFWRDGLKEVGPGLTLPEDMVEDVMSALHQILAPGAARVELSVGSPQPVA
jgi:hypothetical protein